MRHEGGVVYCGKGVVAVVNGRKRSIVLVVSQADKPRPPSRRTAQLKWNYLGWIKWKCVRFLQVYSLRSCRGGGRLPLRRTPLPGTPPRVRKNTSSHVTVTVLICWDSESIQNFQTFDVIFPLVFGLSFLRLHYCSIDPVYLSFSYIKIISHYLFANKLAGKTPQLSRN